MYSLGHWFQRLFIDFKSVIISDISKASINNNFANTMIIKISYYIFHEPLKNSNHEINWEISPLCLSTTHQCLLSHTNRLNVHIKTCSNDKVTSYRRKIKLNRSTNSSSFPLCLGEGWRLYYTYWFASQSVFWPEHVWKVSTTFCLQNFRNLKSDGSSFYSSLELSKILPIALGKIIETFG